MANDMKLVHKERATPPFRERDTAVVQRVNVPRNRRALFLALETEMLHDEVLGELAFCALRPCERSLFQLLLYLTYCCKEQVLQVTLENTDFSSMSPPVREDFAHGRLFCFVLDMDNGQPPAPGPSGSESASQESHGDRGDDDADEYISGSQLMRLMGGNGNMSVFSSGRPGPDAEGSFTDDLRASRELSDEAYKAFMRLQLVRQKVVSLNNAMVAMRDSTGELSTAFEWVDIHTDMLNSSKLDRKRVRNLQGSMYKPAKQSGKQAVVLPESIANLSLKSIDSAIGEIADAESRGEGKDLFAWLISNLIANRWRKHKVMRRYNHGIPSDAQFVDELQAFTRALGTSASSSGTDRISVGRLLVFRYSLGKLIDRHSPDMFLGSMLHRHMPVTKPRIAKALSDIRSRHRTRALAGLLIDARCHCPPQRARANDPYGRCLGDCQTAYACFYNACERHPFVMSGCDYNQYFAHLYPHLGKLERLSKEMKMKYRGPRQFESTCELVFNDLVKDRSLDSDSLYSGLTDLMDDSMSNSCLSLGRALPELHEELCLHPPVRQDDYFGHPRSLHPVKVYDHALVRYMFSDSLEVGRLFQASTTFNYIVTNTAPRYTIERLMLFNITGPGEGKTYANNVLNYQFRRVKGCIETLTSFTPQAFKYKQQRNSCVLMIDNAHITHEKNAKASYKESNVIPNTFKNLLDTSVLESDVVSIHASSGKVDTLKYHAVHNCGFVWNTNTLGFVSEAWADRCMIMESEFPAHVTRTRSTKQLQEMVEKQSMIAESKIMQFDRRFNTARDACVVSLYASHIVRTGALSRRASFCINQLVFAEAMKLACHFVFDLWIPPWTKVPKEESFRDLRDFMIRLNENRLKALDKLSFGQICLETNAVYKLCAAACLPDICPRVLDAQGQFACRVLGYILSQVKEQGLKTTLKDGRLCVSGIDSMCFPESDFKGGNDAAHEMLQMCSDCMFPARSECGQKSYGLCSYKCAPCPNAPQARRGQVRPKEVTSVTVPLEAVYDMLALYAPKSHAGFWEQLRESMLDAYSKGRFETVNAFGHSLADGDENGDENGDEDDDEDNAWDRQTRLNFTLDFNGDPICSLILEATAGVEPLNEIMFSKCAVRGHLFRCTAPLYYGGVIATALRDDRPRGSQDARHARESKRGPIGTFHGPRLSVYSVEYAGVPVRNVSSFCDTRTVYHQDRIVLRLDKDDRKPLAELEQDWEWLEASKVFNKVHRCNLFSPESLKRDYAVTMTAVKGGPMSRMPITSKRLADAMKTLHKADGRAALHMRTGAQTAVETQTEQREQHQTARREGRGQARIADRTGKRPRKRTHEHDRGSVAKKRRP